jgi:hypothetical protein
MKLKKVWIDRIFERLAGIYGLQFSAKFPNTEEAKGVWATELGAYDSRPDAIQFALDNLPIDHAPNALEFREICRRAPRDEPKAVRDDTPSNPEKAAEFARKAERLMRDDRDHLAWARRPASQVAMDLVVSGSKRDSRLRRIWNELVESGVCTAEGKLLKKHVDDQWVKA